jgi:hypothetical protein
VWVDGLPARHDTGSSNAGGIEIKTLISGSEFTLCTSIDECFAMFKVDKENPRRVPSSFILKIEARNVYENIGSEQIDLGLYPGSIMFESRRIQLLCCPIFCTLLS